MQLSLHDPSTLQFFLLEMAGPARRKWYHIQWYSDTDTKEERKFIIKLDALIVPYAVLAYWVKYIDQSNLSEFLGLVYRLCFLTPPRQCLCCWS